MKPILIPILLVAFAISCTNNEVEKKEIIRKVKIAAVQKDEEILHKEFPAIIREDRENNLSFRVAGPIQAIYVKEGSYVNKGDLIAEIDQRDYQIQLDVARAQYNQVKAETDRVTEMYKRKSIADIDYEKAVSGEKLVTVQLNHAQNQLRDTKLFAPFSGYIQNINYEKGELINTGMTFATLINLSNFKIEIDIPASLFVMKDNFTSFTCRNRETSGDELPLTLTSFSRKADNNQLYKLFFNLDSRNNKNLAPGMDVKVFVYYKNHFDNSLTVPVEAVFNDSGSACVWIFNAETSTVNLKKVETAGLAGDGKIKIAAGLNGDEKVVVAGVNVLQENQKVEVLKPASETNIGGLL